SSIFSMLASRPQEMCCLHRESFCGCDSSTFWIDPFQNFLNVTEVQDQKGFHANTMGFMVGGDYCFENNIAVGVGAGYGHTNLSWSKNAGHSRSNNIYTAVYANYIQPVFFINAAFLADYEFFHSARHMFFSSLNEEAQNSHHGFGLNTYLSGGADIVVGGIVIRPFLTTNYTYLGEGTFKEFGADSLDIIGETKNTSYWRNTLGSQFSYTQEVSFGCLAATLSFSWVNISPLSNRNYTGRFVNLPDHFVVWGYHKQWNLFAPAFDMTLNLNPGIMMSLSYEGEFGGNYQSGWGRFRFEWNF
ncbi:MAG: autotransporter outer membrane beta-barrel domain-containing protein, partial [Chlamydiae bacterium]|nr:autotransporter outer membrane beta-barrel domain-containing protein [Chlamydiota bacterium]